MMYTLQMWNSYLFVASLDVLVVLLAGFISIFSLRRSQKTIEKVSPALSALTESLLPFLRWSGKHNTVSYKMHLLNPGPDWQIVTV